MNTLNKFADTIIYCSFCILTLGSFWALRVLVTKAILAAKEAENA